MSTTIRRYWLKILGGLGVHNFRSTSGLGFPFVCHVGDFAGEVPFYNPRHSALEISIMAAWCNDLEAPVIFDVGANNGFVSTQLAQLLRTRSPQIYAFEPVPSTYSQLVYSIGRLGLGESVIPVCCALSNQAGICQIAYNPRESLFAQVRDDTQNPRAGNLLAFASTLTLDGFTAVLRKYPALIKIDVEGFEPQVLKGSVGLLGGQNPPAICFEWNPLTLSEIGISPAEICALLRRYRIFYVDDFQGQRVKFGSEMGDLAMVTWACNLFAVPEAPAMLARWNGSRDSITAPYSRLKPSAEVAPNPL